MIILPLRPDASWRHPPFGTIAVGLSLLLIHIAWGRGGPETLQPYLLNFQALSPMQWLTSAFLHANWVHLLGNLVFLFVFGAIVEDYLGRWFVPVYLLLAFASGGLEQCLSLLGHREGCALGASSAIYGLLALAVLWAPGTRVSTFVWLILYKPMMVEIRVLWLAGGYMAMQVVSVWLQEGTPSSEFLHACGIAVGLPLGLLCLRERWVDTNGGDLLAPERPRSIPGVPEAAATPVAPAGIPWHEQAGRVASAAAAGDRRLALAAYDVLRREHPTQSPDGPVIERLMAFCEDGLDFHRAIAIGERAVAAGPVSDQLRLRLARLHGQHLGDAVAGLKHLAVIASDRLDGDSAGEYRRLRDRLERRRQTTRISRSTPAAMAPVLALILGGGVVAAEPAADPWAKPAPDPFAAQPSDVAAKPMGTVVPVLPLVEPKLVTGRLAVAGGASIDLPEDCVYLSWSEVSLFLAASVVSNNQKPPLGLILGGEQFDDLVAARGTARSTMEWEQRSGRFMMSEGPIQVHWEDGWIDTSGGLPEPGKLLSDYHVNAELMTRRQVLGPGVAISIDGWARQPNFDSAKGILAWSLTARFAFTGPAQSMPNLVEEVHNVCYLGATGHLGLILECPPGDAILGDRLRSVASKVAWDKGCAFTPRQPDGIGELSGGLRGIILPRVIFGDPSRDQLVYRSRGLGLAWILILVPVGIAIVILVRRIKAASQVPPVTSGGPSRCPACGSPVPPAAARCSACGKSLVR